MMAGAADPETTSSITKSTATRAPTLMKLSMGTAMTSMRSMEMASVKLPMRTGTTTAAATAATQAGASSRTRART